MPMLLGDVLHESGASIQYLHFPTPAIISIHYLLENGGSSEIAGVGNEGVLGVSLCMGGDSRPSRAMVQTGGHGYRLKASILMEEFNRHHSVQQQLCRWLLLTLDRLPSNALTMTQELIANMRGVRCEGGTEAARRLQSAGHISYRRGHITVLDRNGLEDDVCACDDVVKKEFVRLLSDVRQRQSIK